MKSTLLGIFFLMSTNIIWAQALLEDSEGKSTLYLNTASYTWVRLNTSSSSATMGFNFFGSPEEHGYDINGKLLAKFTAGMDASVSIKDGIGKITTDGVLAPDFGVNFNFGIFSDSLFKNTRLFRRTEMSAFIRGELGYKSFNVANSADPDSLYFDKFTGWTRDIRLIINFVREVGLKEKTSQIFGGISYSLSPYSRFNNEDLDEVTIATPLRTTSNGQILYDNSSGIQGDLKRVLSNPLRVDLAFLPYFTKNLVGINTYYYTETFTRNHVHNLGLGLFFSQANAPKSIIGGITYQLNDLNNINGSDTKNALERATAFFYVGFIFNSKS